MSDERFESLQRRLTEVEIRSEERLAEIQKLEGFVAGYEGRIRTLEAELRRMKSLMEEPSEDLPPAFEDLPPHY